MKINNLSIKLSIISFVSILSGCAVYQQPIDGNNFASSSVIVSNGVTYSSGIYPSYNSGIIYTQPSPLYYHYYPSRPYPYRPHYIPQRPYHPHGKPPIYRPPVGNSRQHPSHNGHNNSSSFPVNPRNR